MATYRQTVLESASLDEGWDCFEVYAQDDLAQTVGFVFDEHAARALAEYYEVTELTEKYGMWGEHPKHKVEDWEEEVSEGSTRLGYWEWVVAQIGFAKMGKE